MSQNCPVVAFDCDYGPREIITNKFNGLLVKISDVKNLSKTLSTILTDKQLNNKIITNGLIRSKYFKAETLAVEWLKN